MNKIALSAVVLIWATLSSHAQNLSPDELARRATERRAVDAVIWGMPAVNYDLMLQEMLTKTPGKVNQVIYWPTRLHCAANQSSILRTATIVAAILLSDEVGHTLSAN